MRTQLKRSSFNQKELNKILPSYLLEEINKEEKEQNQKLYKQQNNFVLPKEIKKVRKKIFILILFFFLICIECKYQQFSIEQKFFCKYN